MNKKSVLGILGSVMIFGVALAANASDISIPYEDFDENDIEIMSYEEYVAAEVDDLVVIETYVQAKQSWWEETATVYTQDEDGAYFVYGMACSEEDYDLLEVGTKIRVTGYKAEWSGEIEIADATFEFVDDGETYIAEPVDVTDLLAEDDLIDYQNQRVSFTGMTVEASEDPDGNEVAFLYAWDGSGEDGSDLYFNVSYDGETYNFVVESDLCDNTTDVYKAVTKLNIGDEINMEGFLYWYEGVNPHITAVSYNPFLIKKETKEKTEKNVEETEENIVETGDNIEEEIKEETEEDIVETEYTDDLGMGEKNDEESEPIARKYEGIGEGRSGDIIVEVTLNDDNVITDLEVIQHNESKDIGEPAMEQLVSLIVETNSLSVDAVTGATISSEGLIEATQNALSEAGVNMEDYQKLRDPSIILTGIIIKATMSDITIQTDNGMQYICSTEGAELNLENGIVIGMEASVLLNDTTSDENGLFYAKEIRDGIVEDQVIVGTIIKASLTSVTIQTEKGDTYTCNIENSELRLTHGIVMGIEVEATFDPFDNIEEDILYPSLISDNIKSADENTASEVTTSSSIEKTESALSISNVKVESGSNYTVCTGTVTNNGSKTYYFIKVKGSFTGLYGKVLDTDWTYASGSEGLAPGESTTFRMSVPQNDEIIFCNVKVFDYN